MNPFLQHPARTLVLGAIVLPVAAGFLFVGGWLSPRRLTPARFVDTFEQAAGVHPGFRRNHAKGLGFTGTFASNGNGARRSRAIVFRAGVVPVTGRFALAGGNPFADDTDQAVRSMAVRFSLPDGEDWRTGMNAMPVFAVDTPEAFRDQLLATRPTPETGKPDPEAMRAFLAAHPKSARALGIIRARPATSGFADSTFNSLNAFILVDGDGRATPVRWSMVPMQDGAVTGVEPPRSPNRLFDDLIARASREKLSWKLVLTMGQPGDPTDDATVAWPSDREQIDAGVLTVDRVESEETSPARTINFDPLILPDGIKGSDDPLLAARSAVYSQSFTRRVGEPVPASAVTPEEVRAGADHAER